MIKNIVVVSVLVSSYLFAMGSSINYDEQFNQVEQQEVNSNSIENELFGLRLDSFVFLEKNGKNVPVKKVKRGTKVVYINRVQNNNNTPKRNIIIKNPIPEGTEYVIGSAICQDGCTISYSTDGGRTLMQQQSNNMIYNYIEFYFPVIAPHKEIRMGFRAIVE
ncbi:MAG: hypothetical protein GXO60_04610 [Epsilonproteobacteria bacterium]|nr:hypothetical protein [Campylobacterota bacterium]